jgi:AP-4 complex subunit epsilon-1
LSILHTLPQLDLLFRMTNAVNVEFIVEKLLTFLSTATDDHFRTDLVGQITQCAERFAPSNAWYVQTIIRVFELAGDKVKASVAQTLTQLIAEGSAAADDDEVPEGELSADDELRTEAVENFLDLMVRPKLPEILAQAVAWVLGEYGYLATSCTLEGIMEKLCALTQQCGDPLTKAHVVSAISKLVAQNGGCPNSVYAFMDRYSRSVSLDVQQRCVEFKLLMKHPNTLVEVLPVDASCEDIEVDEELSFLNEYVQNALKQGAKPYSPPQSYEEDDGDADSQKTKLKITPYAVPTLPVAPSMGMVSAPGLGGNPLAGGGVQGPGGFGSGAAPLVALTAQSIATSQGNQLIGAAKGNQVWGRKPELPSPAQQQPVATPAPPVSPLHSSTQSSSFNTPSHSAYGNSTPGASSSGAVSGYAAEPVPQAPRELSEREKQAAALFGGLGASSSSGRTAKPPQRRSTATAAAATATAGARNDAQAQPHSSASAAPEPEQQQPAQPPVAPVSQPAAVVSELLDLDLLGDHVPAPAATLPAASTPLAPTQTSLPVPAPAPAPVQAAVAQPPAPPANAISDAFAGMISEPGGLAASVPAQQATAQVMPLVIVTEEFGKRWVSTPYDAKVSIPTEITALDQLCRAIPPSHHHVQSIPTSLEAIFAATVTSSGSIILLHAKLNPVRKTCDITVKSNSKELGAKEAAFLASSIAAFRG